MVAFRWSGTARHGRIGDVGAAVAGQLVEAHAVTAGAVAGVAQGLTAVQAAAELATTDQHANVILVDAAHLDAFVTLQGRGNTNQS